MFELSNSHVGEEEDETSILLSVRDIYMYSFCRTPFNDILFYGPKKKKMKMTIFLIFYPLFENII